MNKRNVFLDVIRAVSCIFVVLYHYTQRYCELFSPAGAWPFRLSWGYMAVAVFFVLSGYLSSTEKTSESGFVEYVRHKAFRLYPAYWICVLLTFATTQLFLPERSVTVRDLLINITMLQSFVGVPPVDGVYWTLANDLVFYAVIAVVVVLLKKRDKLPIVGLIWCAALIALLYIEREGLVFAAIGKLLVKHYGHMFVLGFGIRFLCDAEGKRSAKLISGVSVLLAFAYQYLIFGVGYLLFLLLATGVILLAVLFHRRGVSLPNGVAKALRPLCFIAEISYPLYLLHQNIGYAILRGAASAGATAEWIILLPIAVTTAAAWLIHRYIELPVAGCLPRGAKNG